MKILLPKVTLASAHVAYSGYFVFGASNIPTSHPSQPLRLSPSTLVNRPISYPSLVPSSGSMEGHWSSPQGQIRKLWLLHLRPTVATADLHGKSLNLSSNNYSPFGLSLPSADFNITTIDYTLQHTLHRSHHDTFSHYRGIHEYLPGAHRGW